jgi:hypothetical protein
MVVNVIDIMTKLPSFGCFCEFFSACMVEKHIG